MAPTETDVASLRDALAVLAGCEDGLMGVLGVDAVASAIPGTPPDAEMHAAPPRLTAPTKPLRRLLSRKAQATKLSPHQYATRWMEVQSLRKEWQAMTTSQKEQLERVQHENGQLRNLIQAERKNAHKIARLLRRALQMEIPVPRVQRVVRFGFDHYRGPREDPEFHITRLDGVLERASQAFSNGLLRDKRSTATAFRDVAFCESQDGENEIGIVFTMAWDLPYPVDEITSALWLQTTRSSPKKSVEWMDLYEDTSVMVSQFIATPTDASEPMVKHGQMAARRVTAHDAMIIIATARIRAFEDEQAKGEANCDTWIRVDGAAQSPKGGPLSHVQWCRRARIQPAYAEFATRQQRAEWIQSAINGPMRACEERKLDWSMQAIENALLDMHRIKCAH